MKKKNMKKKTLKIINHIKNYVDKNAKDNIALTAGQSAFFVLLSTVPFFIFTFSFMTMLGVSQDILMRYYTEIENSFNLGQYIQNIIDETYKKSMEIAFTTIIMSLWSAGNGIFSVTQGISGIYKIEDKRNWFVKRFLATLHTLVMIIVLVVSPALLLLFDVLDDFVEPYVSVLPFSVQILFSIRYILFFVMLVLLISMGLKFYLKNRVQDKRFSRFKSQIPGAVISALGWMLFSKFINIYMEYFNGFSLYGSLAYLAGIMFSMYFTIYIFLCGVQFNYIYRENIYRFSLKEFFKKSNIKL